MFKKKEKLTTTENLTQENEEIAVEEVQEDTEVMEKLLNTLVEHYAIVDKKSLQAVDRGLISKEDFLAQVRTFLSDTQNVTDEKMLDKAIKSFDKYIWGYHVIDDLIFDDDISDIRILDENRVRIKRLGKRCDANVKFLSKKDYEAFVKYVAIKNEVNISDINAIQTFTDKETNPKFILRFDVMTGYTTSTGTPYVQIRKIPKEKRTLNDLLKLGMFNEETKKLLEDLAVNAKGILVTGKGASGKTTLLNAMLDHIPEDCSGLVIQENEELFSNHPELMFQHIITNRGESKIQYTLSDLSRNGLLIDLDYFVIGEIKGGEALYFLNAAYTGHKCWASGHGASSTEAMDKIADYVKYESDYSKEDALRMLHNIEYVIFMKDFKVAEISKVVGWDDEAHNLKYEKIL